MSEDVFSGLSSVQQFDAKLKSYGRNSQVSTAINSTFKSRKSTMFDVSILDTFVERVHYLATNNDRNESARIALDLGIPYIKLQNLNSQQEREDYIIQALQRQVMEQLKQWKCRVESRELQRKRSQPNLEQENNMSIFNWVEIHTKFRCLKRKLKFALIELLNSKENSRKVYSQDCINELTYKKPDMQSIVDELNALLHKVKAQANVKPSFQWTDDMEKQFKVKRNSAKHRLNMLVNSNSFNKVAMGEYIIRNDKEKQSQILREELLQKYDTQQALTEEELIYLVNTSTLLNKCSNKKLLQQVINQLDQEVISDIELTIAENILSQYYKVSKELNQSRHLYFKMHKKVTGTNQSETLTQPSRSEFKKLQIKILKMLRDMKDEKKVTLKQNTDKYRIYQQEFKRGNPIANPLVWKFKDIMMGILERKKREKREKKLATTCESNKPIFPSKTEQLTVKVVQRKTHPSSKLLLKPDQQKKISEYLLKLRKKDYEKDRSNFSLFYSGGPIRQRPYAHPSLTQEESDSTLPYTNNWITPEVELAAANKIKKALRAYVSKKRFEKAMAQKKFLIPQPAKFYQLVQRLHEKRKPIDIDECCKSLKVALMRQDKKKTIKKPQVDYSKIPIPKTMIQLKLKQRKLFLALKVNNTLWIEHSGFIFESSDVNCYDVDMYCPLYYAAKQQSVAFCNFLLINGADVNMPCKNKETPTFAAFASGNIVIINLFVSNGADIDKQNNEGKTPLCYCPIELLKELNLQSRVCVFK